MSITIANLHIIRPPNYLNFKIPAVQTFACIANNNKKKAPPIGIMQKVIEAKIMSAFISWKGVLSSFFPFPFPTVRT
jgi:hypothetical protein